MPSDPDPDPGASAVTNALPAVVVRYLSASARHDIDEIVRCFDDDAVVVDEGQTRNGVTAIRRWRDDVAASGYEYTTVTTGATDRGETDGSQRYDVRLHLEGNFPGGEVDLTNSFVVRGDRIVSLRIVPTVNGE